MRAKLIIIKTQIILCSGCRTILPPPPPVDIHSSCDLVVWRNAPNISYDDITGYDIQLVDTIMYKEMTLHVTISATFFNLSKITEIFLSESTIVQVNNNR